MQLKADLAKIQAYQDDHYRDVFEELGSLIAQTKSTAEKYLAELLFKDRALLPKLEALHYSIADIGLYHKAIETFDNKLFIIEPRFISDATMDSSK